MSILPKIFNYNVNCNRHGIFKRPSYCDVECFEVYLLENFTILEKVRYAKSNNRIVRYELYDQYVCHYDENMEKHHVEYELNVENSEKLWCIWWNHGNVIKIRFSKTYKGSKLPKEFKPDATFLSHIMSMIVKK